MIRTGERGEGDSLIRAVYLRCGRCDSSIATDANRLLEFNRQNSIVRREWYFARLQSTTPV